MPQGNVGLRHVHLRKEVTKPKQYPSRKGFQRFMGYFIYVIVVAVPVFHWPQLLKIWVERNVEGLAITSWIAFTCFSVFWFTYGVLHKDKPLIFMNLVLFLTQVLIVRGIFLFR